jgi:hypothetical protein
MVMEHRHSWTVTVEGIDRHVDVIYAALFGWMSIEVDGVRRARAWREVQTVLGGAELSCDLDGHRLDARVTQPFGRQAYAFALRLDGALLPGSDPQPEPRQLRRQTFKAFGVLMLAIFVFTFVTTIVRQLG